MRISVTIYFPNGLDQDEASSLGLHRRGKGLKGAAPFGFPTVVFSPENQVERQSMFEASLSKFLGDLSKRGIDRRFLQERGARLVVYVSLTRSRGFAEVSLTPETIRTWGELDAAFRLDVLPK